MGDVLFLKERFYRIPFKVNKKRLPHEAETALYPVLISLHVTACETSAASTGTQMPQAVLLI